MPASVVTAIEMWSLVMSVAIMAIFILYVLFKQ
jgi:hypothetical protein